MSKVTEVLTDCGIAYKYNGFMPQKPPSDKFYAAVFESTEDIGADSRVLARRFSPIIELYDDGSKEAIEKRQELSDALSIANVKHRRSKADYLYEEKKFLTVYDCDDYIEKWRN